jgi:glycosyltransferase involved in cell wall biosynthesis
LAKKIERSKSSYSLDAKRKPARRRSMVAMDRHIHELEALVGERKLRVQELEAGLAVRAQREPALESELLEQRQQVTSLQSLISGLHRSSSWRLTSPLRGFKQLLLRLKRSNIVYFISQISRVIIARSDAPLHDLRAVRKIARSDYFDKDWYVAKNPDVANSHIDPARHYFTAGWREGRDPSAAFNNRDYLLHNRDVAAAGMNPLAHFIMYGEAEKRIGGIIKPSAKKPEANARLIAAAARYRSDPRPVILMLLHQSGGGTEQHAFRLAATLATRAQVLVLKVGPNFIYNLSTLDPENRDEFQLYSYSLAELCKLLKLFSVQHIHVHHTYGFFEQVQSFLSQMGLPYDLTIHDYMLLCPRTFMYRDQIKNYCGEPDEFGCTQCLLQNPPAMSLDIVAWRWRGRELIEGAERVICPTRDCALRILKYASQANVIVIPHENPLLFKNQKIRIASLLAGQPMRVAVLGAITTHKGIHFLSDCILAWKKAGLIVNLTLIGKSLLPELTENMQITGPYEQTELPRLIADVDPHLIFYPTRCPETYSYTLSEGFLAGVPLLAPHLGAFRERMQGREWCWLYDPASNPDELTDLMRRIRIEHIEKNNPPSSLQRESSAPPYNVSRFFYEEDYINKPLSTNISVAEEAP